jgi:hypothetical protein
MQSSVNRPTCDEFRIQIQSRPSLVCKQNLRRIAILTQLLIFPFPA